MSRFKAWLEFAGLHDKYEQPDLEFKNRPKRENGKNVRVELAKEVAEFANSNGGYILYGVKQGASQDQCGGFDGLPDAEAEALRKDMEEAVVSFVFPRVIHSFWKVAIPNQTDRFVPVVQILASPQVPVGVRWENEHSYRFPIRVGTLGDWLRPDQFGGLEVTARRAAALLAGIPDSQRNSVEVFFDGNPQSPAGSSVSYVPVLRGNLTAVDLHLNSATFELGAANNWSSPLLPATIPLDWVSTVYFDSGTGYWKVAVSARFAGSPQGAWQLRRIA